MFDKELLDKIKSKFDSLPERKDINSYICVDCDKEISNFNIPDEIKETLPLCINGKLIVICEECSQNDDYSEYT